MDIIVEKCRKKSKILEFPRKSSIVSYIFEICGGIIYLICPKIFPERIAGAAYFVEKCRKKAARSAAFPRYLVVDRRLRWQHWAFPGGPFHSIYVFTRSKSDIKCRKLSKNFFVAALPIVIPWAHYFGKKIIFFQNLEYAWPFSFPNRLFIPDHGAADRVRIIDQQLRRSPPAARACIYRKYWGPGR